MDGRTQRKMSNLPPPDLTPSMLKKISFFFQYYHLGKGATTSVPRTVPTDRLVDYFGYMRCPKRRIY